MSLHGRRRQQAGKKETEVSINTRLLTPTQLRLCGAEMNTLKQTYLAQQHEALHYWLPGRDLTSRVGILWNRQLPGHKQEAGATITTILIGVYTRERGLLLTDPRSRRDQLSSRGSAHHLHDARCTRVYDWTRTVSQTTAGIVCVVQQNGLAGEFTARTRTARLKPRYFERLRQLDTRKSSPQVGI